ncbi:MAG: hypothetical protein ACHQ5A_12205 [Opitutales bacterium]
MTAHAPARLTRWMWLAAALLMLGEFLLFDRMTSRQHASIYPRWNDQIQYLTESYTAYEQAQSHGLLAGLKFALNKTALQGTLHDFFAVLAFRLAGAPSRSAALSLNMLVFLAWQAGLLAVIPRVSGSRALAWMGFGLLLCLAGPWSAEAGSAVDFRLDHGAMCLMGLTATLALLTDGFRSSRWSIALGVAVGVTLLERFLTGVYFAAILLVSAAWLLAGTDRWHRLRHLGLAGLVAAALALPVFWANRTAIYTYYWVGQVTGAESAARFRGLDVWHSLQFVFGHLGGMHLGSWFGWTAAGLTTALLLCFILARRQASPGSIRDWLFFSLVFLLLPSGVLILHRQKSEYVLGVIVPGVILLILWFWAWLWRRIDFAASAPAWRLAPLLLALGALAAGGTYFVQRQVAPAHDAAFLASARTVNQIADQIFADSRARAIANPYIAVDQIVDFIDAQILQVICYERKKVWVPFVIQLPDSILQDKDENMLYRMKLCDFVLLTDEMPGDGYWPYDKQMRRLYPQLKAWCESHLRRVETYSLFGRRMSLYERRVNP